MIYQKKKRSRRISPHWLHRFSNSSISVPYIIEAPTWSVVLLFSLFSFKSFHFPKNFWVVFLCHSVYKTDESTALKWKRSLEVVLQKSSIIRNWLSNTSLTFFSYLFMIIFITNSFEFSKVCLQHVTCINPCGKEIAFSMKFGFL